MPLLTKDEIFALVQEARDGLSTSTVSLTRERLDAILNAPRYRPKGSGKTVSNEGVDCISMPLYAD